MTTVPAGKSQADKVLGIVNQVYGPGAKLVMDFDWSGNGPQAAIVWEEGPYDWAIEVISDIFKADLGRVWAEPGTGWFLHVYEEVG